MEVIKVRWYFIFNKVNIATNRRRDHYAGSLQETEVVIFAIRFTWEWSIPISAIFECWSSIHFWPVSFFLLWWLIFVFVFFFFVPKYYNYFRIKKCLQIKFQNDPLWSFHHHFLVVDGSAVGCIAFISTFLRERFQLPITKQRLIPQSLHGF